MSAKAPLATLAALLLLAPAAAASGGQAEEAPCAPEAHGTIQPLVRLRCMARVTRERAAGLKAQLETLGVS